jgi:hypothetical protein
MLLILPATQAWADFIIEFTDGRKVTVGRYVEEGETLKIYSTVGVIGFRKSDVKRITEVAANQSVGSRLEVMSVRQPAAEGAKTSDASAVPSAQEKAADASKGTEIAPEKATEQAKATEGERQRIEEEYEQVSGQMRTIWDKDVQDRESGAAKGVLIENGRKLSEMNNRKRELIEAAHKANPPGEVPAWAQ